MIWCPITIYCNHTYLNGILLTATRPVRRPPPPGGGGVGDFAWALRRGAAAAAAAAAAARVHDGDDVVAVTPRLELRSIFEFYTRTLDVMKLSVYWG